MPDLAHEDAPRSGLWSVPGNDERARRRIDADRLDRLASPVRMIEADRAAVRQLALRPARG